MERLNGIAVRDGAADLQACYAAMRGVAAANGAESGSPSRTRWNDGLGIASGPDVASSEQTHVAIEGRIYNCDDHAPVSGDAELVLRLYERYGIEGALQRINGDFAVAIHDSRNGATMLARDRFGLKPLYYADFRGGFAFSSRMKALLGLPGVDGAPDRQFVGLFAGSHYRYFDNAPGSSPHVGIHQLPAASYLVWRDGRRTIGRYWTLVDADDLALSEHELAEQYKALLLDAVAIRMRRAPRPAFTLSGGMDSSSVLACAVQSGGARQQAFSTVYVDKTYDESDEIRSMLDATVEKWHTVKIGNPDVFGLIDEMIGHHDEPVATATWLSHFLLCRQASAEGFGSFFGGLGGDELNAGEYEHFFYFFADLRAGGLEDRFGQEVEMWAHHHDHPIFRKDRAVAEAQLARVVDLARPGVCLPDKVRMLRYANALNADYFSLATFDPVMDHPFRSYLKNRTYQDITRETVPCCLRAEDRQTAAFGMENFLPFFDHRLAEFMFRVPSAMKYKLGVTKSLLREAMRGILPEETRTRVKKTGWNAPAHLWFSGKGREPLLDLVHSRSFRERGIYNQAEVLRLLDEHEQITAGGLTADNHMMFFWQLVNLELWLRRVDGLALRQ